jgi:uncharacterized protein DUF6914
LNAPSDSAQTGLEKLSRAMPQKNKLRLYIALCSRGDTSFRNEVDCDSYHWALLVGPDSGSREEAGTRYHVRHYRGTPKMFYEEQDMDLSLAQMIHVKIAVAKVISIAQLQLITTRSPIEIRSDENSEILVSKPLILRCPH